MVFGAWARPAAPIATLHATKVATTSPLLTLAQARKNPSALQIMSYYPPEAGWSGMWTTYAHARTQRDFANMKSLGVNTVRIIVQPYAVGWPTMSPAGTAAMRDIMATASADGLFIQLTLFDGWGTYDQVSLSNQWLTSLFSGLPSTAPIALVELQNEIDPTVPSHIAWARSMLATIGTLLPGVPRTLSVKGGPDAASLTQQMLTDLPPSLLDVIDLHLYGTWADLISAIENIQKLNDPRPMIIGEIGAGSVLDTPNSADQTQAAYYSQIFAYCYASGLPLPGVWIYSDIDPAHTPADNPNVLNYGLRRLDGTWKPAAAVIQQYFSIAASTGVDAATAPASSSGLTDSDFSAEAPSPDKYSSLGAWRAAYLSQVSSIGTSTVTGRTGRAAQITGARGTHAQVPAIYQQFPLVKPGMHLSASAWINTSASTGRAYMYIAYFDKTGTYINSAYTPDAVNGQTWTQISLTAVAPTTAAYAQLGFAAYSNPGTVSFDDATLTQTAPPAPAVPLVNLTDGDFSAEAPSPDKYLEASAPGALPT